MLHLRNQGRNLLPLLADPRVSRFSKATVNPLVTGPSLTRPITIGGLTQTVNLCKGPNFNQHLNVIYSPH